MGGRGEASAGDDERRAGSSRSAAEASPDHQERPWQSLNFLPLPHGHGALRGVLEKSSLTMVCCLTGAGACAAAAAAATSGSISPDAAAACAALTKPSTWESSLEVCWMFCTIGAGASWRTTWTCMT